MPGTMAKPESMSPDLPHELAALSTALDAIDADARALVDGLTEETGTWRPAPGSWSVAECLDHLATANRVYLAAMTPPAERALADGSRRHRPALPGFIGGWFARTLEPPARPGFRSKAPKKIEPRPAPPLKDAFLAFLATQDGVRAFMQRFAGIDLAGVRFPNPLVKGIRFSLATGLHVIAAHDRRHIWQGWNVRRGIRARSE
jgi:hypothetical protein